MASSLAKFGCETAMVAGSTALNDIRATNNPKAPSDPVPPSGASPIRNVRSRTVAPPSSGSDKNDSTSATTRGCIFSPTNIIQTDALPSEDQVDRNNDEFPSGSHFSKKRSLPGDTILDQDVRRDQKVAKTPSRMVMCSDVHDPGSQIPLQGDFSSATRVSASSASVMNRPRVIETSAEAMVSYHPSPESTDDKENINGLMFGAPPISKTQMKSKNGDLEPAYYLKRALENSYEQKVSKNAVCPLTEPQIPQIQNQQPELTVYDRCQRREEWGFVLKCYRHGRQRTEIARRREERAERAADAKLGLSLADIVDMDALAMTDLEEAEYFLQSCDLSGDIIDAVQVLSSISTRNPDLKMIYNLLRHCIIWKDPHPQFQEFCFPIEEAWRDGSLLRRLDEMISEHGPLSR